MNSLDRFIEAQKKNYNQALQEIKSGKKSSHWIWYIFPQLKGLGFSTMSEYYGIENIAEAKAYSNNEYLRNNLIQIAQALLDLSNNNPTDILGYPDDLKVKSCMTLFYFVNPKIDVFKKVIDKLYNGEFDINTMALLYNSITK